VTSQRGPGAARGLAALALAGCALVIAATLVRAQADWRPSALAAFDDVWATVNESFYDPTFGGLDWAGVRSELRPRAEKAASPDDVRAVIREMLARLGRSHFALISDADADDALPGEAAPPFEVRIAADGPIVTRWRSDTPPTDGPSPGETILAIDGDPVPRVEADRARQLDAWRDVNRRLHGEPGSDVRLTVRGADGRDRSVNVTRVVEPGQVVKFGNLPPLRVRVDTSEVRTDAGRRVGVIAFNLWMPAINGPVAGAVDRFREADGLVIDLRGNPGGLADMMRGIAGHVVDEPVLLGRMRTRTTEAPLEFKANPRRSTPDGRTVEPFRGPVALLVDELTASTSECFAAGLQSARRVRVFGRQSMGQALPALTKRLPNGDALMYVIGDFVTGTGLSVEGDGVRPDEQIALTPAVLAGGRDPDLAAALRWIDRIGGR
jgi:carboxyl-terminal processing protease